VAKGGGKRGWRKEDLVSRYHATTLEFEYHWDILTMGWYLQIKQYTARVVSHCTWLVHRKAASRVSTQVWWHHRIDWMSHALLGKNSITTTGMLLLVITE
jgi:hypothetical protein